MDSRTIRDVCIRSCEGYRSFLEYMQSTGKNSGRSVTGVNDIEFPGKGEVVLKVSYDIKNFNDMFLTIGSRSYYTDQTNEMVHDPLNRTVSFYPKGSVLDDLRAADVSDVKLVTDMKWLIDVTETYYQLFGHMIGYPDRFNNLYGREEFCLPKDRMPSDEQLTAVEGILNDTTSYVWGTPGAGKTQYVLATAMMTCVREGERVAVIAPTNNALEQVLRGLIKAIRENDPNGEIIDVDNDILRLGTASKQFADEFPNVCERREVSRFLDVNRSEISRLEEELDSTTDPREWDSIRASIAKVKERIAPYEPFDPALKERSVRIIAMTPHRLMMRYSPDGSEGRLPLDVDRIFLDEAGYASLINTLPLFSFGVPVSLLGDHMQLPPVCEMEHDDIVASMHIDGDPEGDCYVWYLSSLYFESMMSLPEEGMRRSFMRNEPFLMERTNRYDLAASYRFGQRLAGLLDRYVYGGIGLSGRSSDELVLEVIDVVYTDRQERNNLGECEAIMQDIMVNGLSKDDFSILTPYSKQSQMINRMMRNGYAKYDISTIHRSQGKEWDTVYISVVDNRVKLPGKDKQLHMTSTSFSKVNVNTLNTAISRAKKRLVIVCDMNFWMDRTGDLIGELVSQSDKVSHFRHDPSNPITFRENRHRPVENRRLYHNGVSDRVPKELFKAYSRGYLKVSKYTKDVFYQYCDSKMLTHEGMEVMEHIKRAYEHVRSDDYDEAAEELRKAVRLHESIR